MLKLYDHLEIILDEQNSYHNFHERKLNYFVSELMDVLDIIDIDERAASLNRAFDAIESLHIPFNQNFKRVFRFDGLCIGIDWKISTLACYLIIVNSKPNHPTVAKAQLYFVLK